jgi:hypothetical protein
MRRLGVTLLLAALAACSDGGGPSGQPLVLLSPILDSLFVGDTAPPGAFTVTYRDAAGDTQPPGVVRWRSLTPTVAAVDSVSGEVVAAGPGDAVIIAEANGVQGAALVIVSRPLDLTLVLDTLYLMPGDTITIPVHVLRRGGGAPAPWFAPSPNGAIYTVDAATGLVTAGSPGATLYIVHADSLVDTGVVDVRLLSDTTGGRAFFSIFGTVIRHAGAQARAVNYRRQGDTLTFRFNAGIPSLSTALENVVVTVRDAVVAPGTFTVDSLSPTEAFGQGQDAICRPPRSWALWSTRSSTTTVTALSRRNGVLTITRVDTVTGGLAISGRFRFDAQRVDFYRDPLGVLPVQGTFVAPLVTDLRPCGS